MTSIIVYWNCWYNDMSAHEFCMLGMNMIVTYKIVYVSQYWTSPNLIKTRSKHLLLFSIDCLLAALWEIWKHSFRSHDTRVNMNVLLNWPIRDSSTKIEKTSICILECTRYTQNVFMLTPDTEFTKLHVGLVVLEKRMSVLINFLLQNTNLVSVIGKICPNFAGHVCQDWHISRTLRYPPNVFMLTFDTTSKGAYVGKQLIENKEQVWRSNFN